MAVGRGVLITSDNSYYDQVQEAAGPNSAWTRAHRLLAGLDTPPPGPLLPNRSRAALQLYCATVHELGAVIALEQQTVIGQAVRLAERVLAA